MRLRSLVLLVGFACLAGVVPAAAQSPYDSSLLPFATKGDPRPDPRKETHFMDDHPNINGLYAKRFYTSGQVMDWLEWLRSDWNYQRDARIALNRELIDMRKSIPEEGATLTKVLDSTPRDAILAFNSRHDATVHDALYAFSQSRQAIQLAEAEVSKAEARIAATNASVDEAAAKLSVLVSTNELSTLAARKAEIMAKAKSGWAQGLLKVARTAVEAIKDPQKAMSTIGLDFVAEGFDAVLTESVLLEHADELAMIADREEALDKLIKNKNAEEIQSKLKAAQESLRESRIALMQAAIRRTVSLADAKHQLMRLALLEEGDEKRGLNAPKLFRALQKYHTVSENMARFVDDAAVEYLEILNNGPSAKAGYLYVALKLDIMDVKHWKGDFSTWLIVAQDTQIYIGRHDMWYMRQRDECLRLIGACNARAHWRYTEGVVSQILLIMEKGGK